MIEDHAVPFSISRILLRLLLLLAGVIALSGWVSYHTPMVLIDARSPSGCVAFDIVRGMARFEYADTWLYTGPGLGMSSDHNSHWILLRKHERYDTRYPSFAITTIIQRYRVQWEAPLFLWCLLILSPPVLGFLRRQYRRSAREDLGLCLECGYDLRGSSDRCPECGATIKRRRQMAGGFTLGGEQDEE